MSKVKILLLGAAFAADLHLDAYSRFRSQVEIVAIVGSAEAEIKTLMAKHGFDGYAVFKDYKEAIASVNCDAVDVCLPNFLHCDASLAALEAGRHVICEKPLATTVDDARKMVEKAKEVGKHLYYAEDWLFAPAVQRALEIVEEGAIGKPLFMRGRECHSGSHSAFAQTIKYCGGGAMIHLGVHPVALALALKENKWKELIATTSGGLENNLVHKKMEGEDWAACIITFQDGTTAVLEANYVTVGGMEDFIDIYGEKGVLHVDLGFSSPITAFSIPGVNYTVEKAEITTGWSNPVVDEKYNLGYVDEIKHFLESIRTNTPAKQGLRGEDGLEVLEVINYIYQSAREGRKIVNPNLR